MTSKTVAKETTKKLSEKTRALVLEHHVTLKEKC